MIRLLSVWVLLISLCLAAVPARQTAPRLSPQTIGEMRQLQQAALESDYAYQQTAYLCNNIGPRLSGSPQAARAVEYVAGEMRKLGLDVKLEKVIVPRWVRGEERGALVEWPGMAQGSTQKIVLTALGGSVATPAGGLTAEVVVVNNYDELNALGADQVKGKIVLFNAKFDRAIAAQGYGGAAYGQAVAYRGGGPVAAAKLGAVAALNRSAGGSQNRVVHTGQTNYDAKVPKIPAAAVSYEDAELIAHLAAQGRVRMTLTLTPQMLPEVESYNVVADLKGGETPDEVVIVSGHLDSWDLGTGALDDAVGVAAAMATAKLFKQLNLKPKRTLRVIAWMNEENGFRGPNTYVETHKNEIDKHYAAIEMDLGAGHPIGFIAGGKPELVSILTPVNEVLRSSGAGLSRTEPRAGSDISVLGARGVPTFEPWVDQRSYFNYHHTPADTLDKVNPRELQENTAVMCVLAYALANLAGPLPRAGSTLN
jgi:Zn-dependent M28 family amino/carboxypeptidase